MRKFFMVTLVAVVAFAFSYTAQADEVVESWMYRIYISGKGQAIIPFEDTLDVAGYGGGAVGYWWNEWVATEIEVGIVNIEPEDGAYDVDIIPLLFTVRGDIPVELGWPMHPYIFGGMGVLFNDGTGVNVDDSLVGHVGIGVDYDFTENFLVFVDLRFLFSQPDVDVASEGVVGSSELDLNSMMIGGGLSLQF